MKNNKINEKVIFLSQFESKVDDGPVRFVIVDAKNDVIRTKKGTTSEVIKLDIEITDIEDSSKSKEIKSFLMFENYTSGGVFHKFIKSFLDGTKSTNFTVRKLIGLKGKVELSHYKPEDAEIAYPRLTNWIFDAPNNEVSKTLEKYKNDEADSEIDF